MYTPHRVSPILRPATNSHSAHPSLLAPRPSTPTPSFPLDPWALTPASRLCRAPPHEDLFCWSWWSTVFVLPEEVVISAWSRRALPERPWREPIGRGRGWRMIFPNGDIILAAVTAVVVRPPR